MTGNIKKYQIVVGGILLLNFPFSYICLKIGMIPESTIVVSIIISQICLVARLWFLRSMIKLSARQFLKKVYFNVIVVTVIATIPPMLCYYYIEFPIARFITTCTISIISSLITIYFMGCNREEKELIKKYITQFKHKFSRQ